MASLQQQKPAVDTPKMTAAGTGPEYEYPTTKEDEPVAVLSPSEQDDELTADDPAKAPAEDAPPLSDAELAREEELENAEAGEWSEDMAENEPRPGEADLDPDMQPVPSDRG